MKVLRVGGEYLASRESRGWMALGIIGVAILLMAVPGVGLRSQSPVVRLVAIVVAVAVLLYAKSATRTIVRHLRATRKGRLGEHLTTQLVSRLSDDYFLINDLVLARGNIDHVIVGPCGILVIETKRVAGNVVCHGDYWTVRGRRVKSYSKQAKAGAVAVKTFLTLRLPELRDEYVEAAVVLTDPLCRVTVSRAQVPVVRFSELLSLIVALASKRRMDAASVRRVADALRDADTATRRAFRPLRS